MKTTPPEAPFPSVTIAGVSRLHGGSLKLRLLFLLVFSCASLAQNGGAIFKQRCAACHESPVGRTPALESLRAMSDNTILRALETGAMREQAKDLTAQERMAVAAYLTGGFFKVSTASPAPPSAYCTASSAAANTPGPGWNGFGAGLTNTRFQGKDAAGLTASDVPRLRLRWAFGLGDVTIARGQPVIVGNRLFVSSAAGKLYALDARTGCLYWTFDADSAIRSGGVVGPISQPAGSPVVFFGDAKANAYALDVATGKLVWKVHPEDHYVAMITDTPNFYAGVVYLGVSSAEEISGAQPNSECCTFRGSVVALDATTGKTLWKTYTIAQPAVKTTKTQTGVQRWGPSGAGVWSTPTIDVKRNAIYVSTGDNYSDPTTDTSDAILALDRDTGKILWSRQMTANDAFTVDCPSPVKTNCPDSNGPDFDFGQPPILVSLPHGKQELVIGQKSGVAFAVDPDQQGKVLWQTRVGKGSPLGGIQWGSAADENNMYVALSDIAFMDVKDPANPAKPRSKLDPTKGGGLFALDLATGNKVWSAPPPVCGERQKCSPAQSAAVTAIPGAVFSGAEDGHFRAYSTATGNVIWDYDTAHEYKGVNGEKTHGGAMDGGGPAIAGGMVYVYSGYGQWGGIPGNTLLAFSVDGK